MSATVMSELQIRELLPNRGAFSRVHPMACSRLTAQYCG
jgi:hypothetical protein